MNTTVEAKPIKLAKLLDSGRPFLIEVLAGRTGHMKWRRWASYRTRTEATKEMAKLEVEHENLAFRVRVRDD